jgi:hypothetical protein
MEEDSDDDSESKQWNFLKMHALSHSFDNIEAKGATCNYYTKPTEKLHAPLKNSYARQTNFRDVAMQVYIFQGRTFAH